MAGTVLATLLLLSGGVGWYVSEQIIDSLRVPIADGPTDTDVVAVSADQVRVVPPDTADAAADRDAVMGLRWDGGYARVGPTVSVDGDVQTRPFELLEGRPPRPGTAVAQFHGYAFPEDPAASGFDVETVTYPSPLGDLEAWYLPGEGTTWIIGVHGRGEDRAELLRMADATRQLGLPTLIVRYRNDPESPSSRDGIVLAGQEEWEDVAAAVDHAVENGATGVVLHGNSMGAALAIAHAMRDDSGVVRGLVLDAPMADLREVVRLRSSEALPVGGPVGDAVLAVGRTVTWLRTGLDFDTVDYVDRADELDVPVLLFHGEDDPSVPFAVGEALADARPDLVEFHPVTDAAHVRAWNEDPDAYASTIAAFLAELGRT